MTSPDDESYSKPSTINHGGGVFTDEDVKQLEDICEMPSTEAQILRQWKIPDLIARVKAAERYVDAAEMLWIVLANVSEGDWKKQSADWQEAAARWRDNWHIVFEAWKKAAGK